MGLNFSKFRTSVKSNYLKIKRSSSSINLTNPSLIKKNFHDEFKFIDGRRYHNVENIHYFFPNDDLEIDRLQLQHYMMRFIWRSNFSSPVRDLLDEGGARVLDVGCGPATWVLEMASEFPKSEFIGVDVVPVMPLTIKPKNVNFEEANLLDGLPFPDNHFDFTYIRFLNCAFPFNLWTTHVIPELIRVTKPGGYIEIMEWDTEIYYQGPITGQLMDALIKEIRCHNIDDKIPEKMTSFLQDSRKLKNITNDSRDSPIGKHGGKVGTLALDNSISAFKLCETKFAEELGLTLEEYNALFEFYKKEVDDYKSHIRTHRFWAEKI
ncbi:S-adenosyl-L-methionine-dependent methyltransferase [Gigaspora margarita]|uniref:S-adenosyl-L-methionine-dependent methyltransferase n=1 Tax=Gigaspora margarita TaxID=4874 RepID=A0A8H4B3M1_GIGMA|nr:S-adenosyl-L-methionine-dependent methyltransferase [Gigaspora margarita]